MHRRSPSAVTRRLCGAGLALAVSFASLTPGHVASAASPNPPNVVLIISDDQHWGDYGFMGHPKIETPRLDRLAAQSLVFPRGYVPSSLCCPSLASIITGRYPHEHKITSNDPPNPDGLPAAAFNRSKAFQDGREVMNRFMDAMPTLPRLLAQRGYASFQSGKWWQGDFRGGGFTHGMTQGNRHGDVGLDIGRKTLQPIFDFITEAQSNRQPFLVWYAPMMPHQPHTPPDRLFEKYKSRTPSQHVTRYWAMIEWFDETCGQLLDYLDQRRLATNTLVLYVTDNGWITDPEKGGFAPKSKQSPYDGGLRTPILVRWPGHVTPVRSSQLASSLDILPTVLAAAGIPLPPGVRGINLLDTAAVAKRTTLFGECFTHSAVDLTQPARNLRWRWAIEDNWKLIVPDPINQPGSAVELYNLAADPDEETNLALNERQRAGDLRRRLEAWWNPSRVNEILQPPNP